MSKKLALLAAPAFSPQPDYAASVPLFSFWDHTNSPGILNGLIHSINSM